VAYALTDLFGNGAVGVILVLLSVVGLIAAAFASRLRRGPALTAAEA
jgi:PiT family inorganic phosphate transporter